MPTENSIVNLDYMAATRAQEALALVSSDDDARNMDTVATNALGVLQEMGVYTCFLFLFSRRDRHKKYAQAIQSSLLDLLGDLPFIDPQTAPLPNPDAAMAVLDYVTTNVTAHLDRVLLTRQVYEQMLLYIRYGASALKSGN